MRFRRLALPLATLLLATATAAQADVVTQDVEYSAGDTKLIGYLAYDEELEGPRPAVIVVHEWWGLNDYPMRRARDLAELGYIAFAVDMYGDRKVGITREEAGALAGAVRGNPELLRERFEAGLEVVRNLDLVGDQPIGAMGYCFGGTVVMTAALQGLPLAGVVSFHGSLPDTTAEQAEMVKGSMLIANGKDDAAVPEEARAKFTSALDAADVDYLWIDYANAVHAFTNPAAGDDPSTNAAYNERADMRSWEHMEEFWDEVLGDPLEDEEGEGDE
ncbi:MAG TPA: dienelactone hydrolase family protein [bacterium]|nr:dienelactone hydrolase family protein [bacterium]